jgi:hypothetical protein
MSQLTVEIIKPAGARINIATSNLVRTSPIVMSYRLTLFGVLCGDNAARPSTTSLLAPAPAG